MLPPDRCEVFARHSQLAALLLEALVALALLLAVLMLRLGTVLLERDAELGLACGRRGFQLARRWAVLFALLVTSRPAMAFS